MVLVTRGWDRLKKKTGLALCLAMIFLLSFATYGEVKDHSQSLSPRQEMIKLVQELRQYARAQKSDFVCIGNNGLELMMEKDELVSENELSGMLAGFDGMLLESFFYGSDMESNKRTPLEHRMYLMDALKRFQGAGKPVFNIEYANDPEIMGSAYRQSQRAGLIPLAADRRELNNIPQYPATVWEENASPITKLGEARNFLALFNPDRFETKEEYLQALERSRYDVLIIDAEYQGERLEPADVARLQRKPNGVRRLVLSYFSIGEAESYRAYWKEEWNKKPPAWIVELNQDWEHNYRVKYWAPEWKQILYGSPSAQLDRILQAGFDGVFLDVVDVYQYL